MNCPRCNSEMEHDEVGKNDQVMWFCETCEFEASGTRVACEGDYDDGVLVPCDWEETFNEKNGGYEERQEPSEPDEEEDR